MAVSLFDPIFYRAANPDLAGLNDGQALSHFQNNGLYENRPFSPFANLNFYRSSNPDLVANGVNTNRQAFDHLQNFGVAEGRSFSEFVDINYYLLVNPDVSQAIEDNPELALEHLRNSGVNEGRSFSLYVDLGYYLSTNPDVNQVTGGNRARSLEHLEIFGLSEGRRFSPAFDVNFYRNAYPNLKEAGLTTNRQFFEHWLNYGAFSESRSGTPDPGNSLNNALNLGSPANSATFFNDFVNSTDSNDYYPFTLNESRTVVTVLFRQTTGLDVTLLDNNGNLIKSLSSNAATREAANSSALSPGTYFIRVNQSASGTPANYTLGVGVLP